LCSHILADVEQVCDRVALLKEGKVQQIGTVEELVGQSVRAVEVIFEALSPETAVGLGFGAPLAQSQGRITFEVADQVRAGALVAAALATGAEIVSVQPRRESLEQLFLNEMTGVERIQREKP
jgi:ABC-2 type transport system ATP-binding protein